MRGHDIPRRGAVGLGKARPPRRLVAARRLLPLSPDPRLGPGHPGGSRDGAADRGDSPAVRGKVERAAGSVRHLALPARQLQRHVRRAGPRRAPARRRRADRLFTGLPVGDHDRPRPGDHARGRVCAHRRDLPEHLGARDDGERDPPGDGGRRRQSVPSRSVLSAGRRYGPAGRADLYDRPGEGNGPAHTGHPRGGPGPGADAPLQVDGVASLTEADGPPAWDVVAAHLRSLGRVRIAPRARVKVVGRKGE